nr:vacuolar iron transporter family (VIT) [Polytomella parva]|mmetsp:Transcript_7597/g.14924  ORF Transcript_7597/g.14924 Transcript_7597/m.14924 type:complete len:251 (-) Transcript_7597:1524-2276(-)|eukprot:CAMPEP_0175039518 /NCGR_PEP_ID=MMETSP0052_2-20121109/638_1 /TAXON_ID=51329 ORGANISM="Polytomella parva, Strain SAG 63-3" /NCGR_SAMPLE_ID=MMETSP0052_2 /ASSEMBLY_ACC=CAM_ASM_000194 /LENGTH=250 /DNA_ID=CAMNT_0016301399 /DNA_START=22 /DNA_END=774 /DNA_ORIENTATION=-
MAETTDLESHQPLIEDDGDEHIHYSHRSAWLRAFVLGANDGLVSVASLMLGVGGGTSNLSTLRLAGIASWIAGALSMACGEYISVASQRDTEEADIEKERNEQRKGPEAQAKELEELAQIYVNRGLSYNLAARVAAELTAKDVIRAHARDELGIDMDDLANPFQASVVSAGAFTCGAGIPLLAGLFLADNFDRMIAISIASALGLMLFGFMGSYLGGASGFKGAFRVLIGGCIAMACTFGIGRAFGTGVA